MGLHTRFTQNYMKILKKLFIRPIAAVYNQTHWFTDREAWGVYRFAAFVEAGFWLYFILSLIYGALELPLGEEVVRYGRSLFGTAFAVYTIFILVAARSMEWGIGRILVAIFAGLPPFGSIVFERVVGAQRTKNPPRVQPPSNTDD